MSSLPMKMTAVVNAKALLRTVRATGTAVVVLMMPKHVKIANLPKPAVRQTNATQKVVAALRRAHHNDGIIE